MAGAPRLQPGWAAPRDQGPPAAAAGGRRALRGDRVRPEPRHGGGPPGTDASGLPLRRGWNALFLLDFAASGIFRPYRRRGAGVPGGMERASDADPPERRDLLLCQLSGEGFARPGALY